jgi:ribosomal protein L34E
MVVFGEVIDIQYGREFVLHHYQKKINADMECENCGKQIQNIDEEEKIHVYEGKFWCNKCWSVKEKIIVKVHGK